MVEQVMTQAPGNVWKVLVKEGDSVESGDVIATDRAMPELRAGDLIAVRDAGAYGAVMSSSYNSRPPAAEAMVHGGEAALIRPRLNYDALLARDHVPDWISGP